MSNSAHESLSGDLPLRLRMILPIVIGVSILTTLIVFTQLIAARLRFGPLLGPPAIYPLPEWLVIVNIVVCLVFATLLHRLVPFLPYALAVPPGVVLYFLGQGPVYRPTEGLRWALALIQFSEGRGILLDVVPHAVIAGSTLVIIGLVFSKVMRHRYHPARIAHGSARYATERDLKQAGLFRPGGVFLGTFPTFGRQRAITDDSQHHTLFVMPSGAGKTAGHIIPSLLTRMHSAFVLDPKGELYDATAGYRASQGHRCIRLAPLDPGGSHRNDAWNPLLEIEPGVDDIATLSLLAEALIVSSGMEDSHWDESARALFRCLALHSLYTGDPPSMRQVRALAHHRDGLEVTLQGVLDTDHDPTERFGWYDPDTGKPTRTHPEAALLAHGFLNTPEREMGSIASTLRRSLSLWGDPNMVAATTDSDFTLNVFNQPQPVTLYVVIPYSDLHRLAPWVRILLASLMRRITHHRNVETAPPLDLYLDEFASLGRVTIIHKILSFLRGYGVRAHIVVQSYEDLHRLYGPNENISACQIHVAAATQSRASRQFISDLGGEATVRWERRSESGRGVEPMGSRHNRTPTETRRPLITQGEVGTLGPDEILIAKTGLPLIRARKRFYFQDRVLAGRAGIPWRS